MRQRTARIRAEPAEELALDVQHGAGLSHIPELLTRLFIPHRAVSIYVDPADSGHAWISYSGYNAVTPSTPGHVFDVHENGTTPGSGTFANLNIESGSSAFPTPFGDGDLPVSDVVRDDATHTLYAATDFGVLRGDNNGTSWHVTAAMPRYEVMHLAIQPSSRAPTCIGRGACKRVLYAATHSQGIWSMNLGGIAR